MTRIIVDPELWSKLHNPQGPVELCDPDGRTLAFLYPAPDPLDVAGDKVVSPFTNEELSRREHEPGGRSLEEIIGDLSKQ